MTKQKNRYERIIEKIFLKYYKTGSNEVLFNREDIEKAASELELKLPKNLGDIIYSFRYRAELPVTIKRTAPKDFQWIIRPAGRACYKFVIAPISKITPSEMLLEIKIPDATPGIIDKYALNDEQALLAKLRYNRLVDIFTGLTCYSLQSHLRTTVPGLGQVETDEIYIGIDKNGAHFILTVQAKGSTEKIGIVQIEQDIELCRNKFPELLCRPLAAQFIENNLICLFEFIESNNGIKIVSEKHYRLVNPEELSTKDIEYYKQISSDQTD